VQQQMAPRAMLCASRNLEDPSLPRRGLPPSLPIGAPVGAERCIVHILHALVGRTLRVGGVGRGEVLRAKTSTSWSGLSEQADDGRAAWQEEAHAYHMLAQCACMNGASHSPPPRPPGPGAMRPGPPRPPASSAPPPTQPHLVGGGADKLRAAAQDGRHPLLERGRALQGKGRLQLELLHDSIHGALQAGGSGEGGWEVPAAPYPTDVGSGTSNEVEEQTQHPTGHNRFRMGQSQPRGGCSNPAITAPTPFPRGPAAAHELAPRRPRPLPTSTSTDSLHLDSRGGQAPTPAPQRSSASAAQRRPAPAAPAAQRA